MDNQWAVAGIFEQLVLWERRLDSQSGRLRSGDVEE